MTEEPDRMANARPDYHDPLAGFAGAPAAISALTARLVFAIFGFVVAAGGAVLLFSVSAPLFFPILLTVLAVVMAIDIVVIVRRKRRGEPG